LGATTRYSLTNDGCLNYLEKNIEKHLTNKPGLTWEPSSSSNCGAVGSIHGGDIFPYFAFGEEIFCHS